MGKYLIIETTFADVRPMWADQEMWNSNEVKPVSSMKFYDGKEYFGGNDMSVYDLSLSKPKFFIYIHNDEPAGCISYHLIDNTIRSRGIFVYKKYRGQKISEKLLRHVIDECRHTRPESFIWVMAGPNSMHVHSKCGFEQVTEQFKNVLPDKNLTQHNNCYMRLFL